MSIFSKIKALFQSSEAKEIRAEVNKNVEELREEVRENVEEVREEIREASSKVQDKARETVDEAKHQASEVAHDVRHRVAGMIDYDTFKQIEVRVGTILSVEKIEKSDKLLLLKVDVGEEAPRQIVSGIATYFENPQSLKGRQAMFVTNLEPRTIFGYESNGMIFAVNDEESFSILEPDTPIVPGTRAS